MALRIRLAAMWSSADGKQAGSWSSWSWTGGGAALDGAPGISKLRSGKRRPCCFDLAACTDPDLSKNGVLAEIR